MRLRQEGVRPSPFRGFAAPSLSQREREKAAQRPKGEGEYRYASGRAEHLGRQRHQALRPALDLAAQRARVGDDPLGEKARGD